MKRTKRWAHSYQTRVLAASVACVSSTARGLTSPNREPVLKGKVRRWLAMSTMCSRIARRRATREGVALWSFYCGADKPSVQRTERFAPLTRGIESLGELEHAMRHRRRRARTIGNARMVDVADDDTGPLLAVRDDGGPKDRSASNAPGAPSTGCVPPCAAART
jgi:hypothetical protein